MNIPVKKFVLGVAILSTFFTSLSSATESDELSNFGFRAYHSNMSDSNFDDATGVELIYTKDLNEMSYFELTLGSQEIDVEQPSDGRGLDKGDLRSTHLLLGAGFQKGLTEKLKFRLGGGIGVLFNDYEIDKSISDLANSLGLSIEEEVDNSFASYISTGLDYSITENVDLSIFARYLHSKADAKGSLKFGSASILTSTGTVDLSSLQLGGGVSFKF